jgi:hypothetical protein
MIEKICINGKTYKIHLEKAVELGILEEESNFKISTDETGAMVISE